jgi:GNAT superfamily N-acetyltransferase
VRSLAILAEAFRRVARTSASGWVEERDHVVSVATGMPVAAFNPTFVLAPPRDPEAALARVRAFYARAGVAGEISASGGAAAAIADAARSAGFVAGHRVPCMVLAPLVATTPATPGLEVRRVEDAAALRTFNDVCAEAFGLDRPILAVLDDPRLLDVPGFGFHLGLVEGRAVGTAMTCCIDGVALIFNVATHPSHRRRGIGEAMTWSAVDHGIEAGCDLAFLQATPDGRPLYERMGFEHVTEMATWSLV